VVERQKPDTPSAQLLHPVRRKGKYHKHAGEIKSALTSTSFNNLIKRIFQDAAVYLSFMMFSPFLLLCD
jgi:hypothetical protein